MIRISAYYEYFFRFHDRKAVMDRLKRIFKHDFINKIRRGRAFHSDRELPFDIERAPKFIQEENRYILNVLRSNYGMLFNRSYLAIEHLDVVLTTRCTLSCRDCGHLIPAYAANGRHPFDMPAAQVIEDLRKLTSSVDYIADIVLMGGEPFLYKELPIVLSYLADNKKVGHVMIVSNGTIIPDESILHSIRKNNASVHINDYGLGSISAVRAKLADSAVLYEVSRERTWSAFQDAVLRNLARDDLEKKFRACHFSTCKNLMDGILAGCAVSQHGTRNGLFPEFPCDRISIHKYSSDQLRCEIKKLYQRSHYECCNYCGYGGLGENVKAGIQNE